MPSELDRARIARQIAALVLGAVTAWVVLGGSFAVLRGIWPDYASAEPEKAYTLAMLFVRLFIFSSMIAATSVVAALVARSERFAWIAGGLIFAYSIPPHLYPGTVWDDYPAWYHIVYLLSILPIAVVAGRLAFRRASPG